MTGETDRKLIVAYLGRGMAHEVACALNESLGLDAFHYGHGRAAGMLHAISGSDMTEVDFLSVIVTGAQADETFAFIYETGKMDQPGGGMIVQLPLARAAATGLPLAETQAQTENM
jgi:hypothetical protein